MKQFEFRPLSDRDLERKLSYATAYTESEGTVNGVMYGKRNFPFLELPKFSVKDNKIRLTR